MNRRGRRERREPPPQAMASVARAASVACCAAVVMVAVLAGCPTTGGGSGLGELTSDLIGLPDRSTFDTAFGIPGTLIGFRIGQERLGLEALGGVSLQALDTLEMTVPATPEGTTLPVTYQVSSAGVEGRAVFSLYGGTTFSSEVSGSSGFIRITQLSGTQFAGDFEFELKRVDGTGSVRFANGRFRAALSETRTPAPTPAPTPSATSG